jgi:hypothetical protein
MQGHQVLTVIIIVPHGATCPGAVLHALAAADEMWNHLC